MDLSSYLQTIGAALNGVAPPGDPNNPQQNPNGFSPEQMNFQNQAANAARQAAYQQAVVPVVGRWGGGGALPSSNNANAQGANAYYNTLLNAQNATLAQRGTQLGQTGQAQEIVGRDIQNQMAMQKLNLFKKFFAEQDGSGGEAPAGASPTPTPMDVAAAHPTTLPVGGFAEKQIALESGGTPDPNNATSSTSSATGAAQFTNGTWLDTIKATRPDLTAGKTDAEILALRSDPRLSAEMTASLAQKNSATLASANVAPTAANVSLAHRFGAAGAQAIIKADPSTPIENVVSAEAIKANPSLQGQTTGSVVNNTRMKWGQAADQPVSFGGPAAAPAGGVIDRAQGSLWQPNKTEAQRAFLNGGAGIDNPASLEQGATMADLMGNTELAKQIRGRADTIRKQYAETGIYAANGQLYRDPGIAQAKAASSATVTSATAAAEAGQKVVQVPIRSIGPDGEPRDTVQSMTGDQAAAYIAKNGSPLPSNAAPGSIGLTPQPTEFNKAQIAEQMTKDVQPAKGLIENNTKQVAALDTILRVAQGQRTGGLYPSLTELNNALSGIGAPPIGGDLYNPANADALKKKLADLVVERMQAASTGGSTGRATALMNRYIADSKPSLETNFRALPAIIGNMKEALLLDNQRNMQLVQDAQKNFRDAQPLPLDWEDKYWKNYEKQNPDWQVGVGYKFMKSLNPDKPVEATSMKDPILRFVQPDEYVTVGGKTYQKPKAAS